MQVVDVNGQSWHINPTQIVSVTTDGVPVHGRCAKVTLTGGQQVWLQFTRGKKKVPLEDQAAHFANLCVKHCRDMDAQLHEARTLMSFQLSVRAQHEAAQSRVLSALALNPRGPQGRG